MGGQFKDASAQNGCRAIHLLLEKTTGCQVPLNIPPSIRPSIHPSIYLSISLSLYLSTGPPNRGGRRHQGASPFYKLCHIISYYIVLYHIISYLSQKKNSMFMCHQYQQLYSHTCIDCGCRESWVGHGASERCFRTAERREKATRRGQRNALELQDV